MKSLNFYRIFVGFLLIITCRGYSFITYSRALRKHPYIIRAPKNVSYQRHIVPLYENVVMECEVEGGYWRTLNMNSSSSSTLSLNATSSSAFGRYYCYDLTGKLRCIISFIIMQPTNVYDSVNNESITLNDNSNGTERIQIYQYNNLTLNCPQHSADKPTKFFFNNTYIGNGTNTFALKVITINQTGLYSCQSCDYGNCKNYTEFVKVEERNPLVVSVGSALMLQCSFWEEGYKWYYDLQEIPPNKLNNFVILNNYLLIENVTKENAGFYACNRGAENIISKEYECLKTVQVDDGQHLVEIHQSDKATTGQNVTLKCTSDGEPMEAEWFRYHESEFALNMTDIELQLRFIDSYEELPEYIEYLETYLSNRPESLPLNFLQPEDEGWYICVPRNHNIKPSIMYLHISPDIRNIEFGADINLSCPVNITPKLNITWTKNGKPIERLIGYDIMENGSLYLDHAIRKDSGLYTCILCNYENCGSHNITLHVNSFLPNDPMIVDKYLSNQTVLIGNNVSLECRVFSDDKISEIRWIYEPRRFLDSTNNQSHLILNLTNVAIEQSGWYTCYTQTSLRSASKSIYLTVLEAYPTTTSPISFDDEIFTMEPKMNTTEIAMRPTERNSVNWFVAIVLLFIALMISLVYKIRKLNHRLKSVPKWSKEVVMVPDTSDDSLAIFKLPRAVVRRRLMEFSLLTFEGYARAFDDFEFPLDMNWEIPRHQLKMGCLVGGGAFGRVFTCELQQLRRCPNIEIAAIKMPKEDHTETDITTLFEELEILKMIGKHINVVRLLGCCTHGGPLWVVMEYAMHGNLKNFLQKHRPGNCVPLKEYENQSIKIQIDVKQMTNFAYQIARGMDYLSSKRLIHRDLAARNILVSDGLVIKIADFGLARDIKESTYYRKTINGRVPLKWMAPECLKEQFYNSLSDVWSFSVVLWEITSYGDDPYSHIDNLIEMYNYLKAGQRLERPADCSQQIFEVMQKCWQFDANDRPSFSHLVVSLNNLLKSLIDPNDAYLELLETISEEFQDTSELAVEEVTSV